MKKTADFLSGKEAARMMDCYLSTGRDIYWTCTKETNKTLDPIDVLSKMVVANTNLSFSCEIGLKLLVYAETQNSIFNNHDLKQLFFQLSEQSKTVIIAFTIMRINAQISNRPELSEDEFYQQLEENKNAFIESRYWYEHNLNGTKKMGNLFILSFAEAISKYVNMFPFKEQTLHISTAPTTIAND